MKIKNILVFIIVPILFFTVGVFYPKTEYYCNFLKENDLKSHFSTPFPTTDIVNSPEKYVKPFYIDFYQGDRGGIIRPNFTLLINKKYEKYNLYEIYYEWENGNYSKNYNYTRVINYNNSVYFKDGWYFGDYVYPIEVNMREIFKKEEKGKEIIVKIVLKYNFDDEEIKFQELFYNVYIKTVIKHYSPLMTIFMNIG